MTISLTERARNRRLIALQAIHINKLGSDSGVVMLRAAARDPQAFFTSTRTNPMNTLFMAA